MLPDFFGDQRRPCRTIILRAGRNQRMSIEYEEDCCPFEALRSVPPERIQKTPAGHISRPLPPAEIFGVYHHLSLTPIARAPQPMFLSPFACHFFAAQI